MRLPTALIAVSALTLLTACGRGEEANQAANAANEAGTMMGNEMMDANMMGGTMMGNEMMSNEMMSGNNAASGMPVPGHTDVNEMVVYNDTRPQ